MQLPTMRQIVMEFTGIRRDFDDEDDFFVHTGEWKGKTTDYNIWLFKMLHDPANEVPVGEEVGVFIPVTLSNGERVKSRQWFKTLLDKDDFKIPRCKAQEEKDKLKRQYESECIGKRVIGYQPDPQKDLIVTREYDDFTSYTFKGVVVPCPDKYDPTVEAQEEKEKSAKSESAI